MFNWFFRKSSTKQVSGASSLTNDEKRYAIATLYLSQFAIFHNDFFRAIEQFDMTRLEPMPDSNQGRKRYFDPAANAAISIGSDACMVQIIGAELDKFAGTMEESLTITGGTATIKKVEPTVYAGSLVKDGKPYNVQVSLDATGEEPMLSAGIWRMA